MERSEIQRAIQHLTPNEQIKVAAWMSKHIIGKAGDADESARARQKAIREAYAEHIPESSEARKEEIEFLISQYEEHTEQGRHLETERSTVTNIIGAVAAAILVYMGSKDFHAEYWWVGLTLTFLGAYGFLMTTELYARFLKHMDFAYGCRYALEQQLSASTEITIRQIVNHLHIKRFHLHKLWPAFNLFIAILGIVLAVWIYIHPAHS